MQQLLDVKLIAVIRNERDTRETAIKNRTSIWTFPTVVKFRAVCYVGFHPK